MMWLLSGIYGLFTLIQNITSVALFLTVTTGKIIVNTFFTIILVVSISYESCKSLITVILEDFVYFLCDFYIKIEVVARFFQSLIGGIVFGISDIIYFTFSLVNSLFNAISTGCFKIVDHVFKLYHNCLALIEGIKYLLVLLGSGIWFAISLIPLLLLYATTMCVYYTGKIIEEGYFLIQQGIFEVQMSCFSIYEFVTDVPLESAAGLITGISIAYVIVKFHIVCLQYCRMMLIYCRTRMRTFFNYFVRTNSISVTRESNNYDVTRKNLIPGNNESDERHCVICQERQKCILLMPCRHVCLCKECSQELRRYQRQCPVCRTLVVRQMQVFV